MVETSTPEFGSALVNGTSLVITFSGALGAADSLANSAFSVKKTPQGGTEQAVALTGSPEIDGATVTLTLGTAVTATDTDIKVSYTQPSSGTDNKLVDGSGNLVESFGDTAVVVQVNSAATGAPAISGTTEVGVALTAALGTVADANGLPGSFPDDYALQWVRVDADGTSNLTDIAAATAITYTLAADDRGKKVKMTLSFTDDDGYAEERTSAAYPDSGTVTRPDNTVPGALRNLEALVISETRIDLTWSAPAFDGDSPITGYRIEWSSNGSSWQNLTANTGDANTRYSNTGLTDGTTRHYRVSAINAVGTGDASDTARATTYDPADGPRPGKGRINTGGITLTLEFDRELDDSSTDRYPPSSAFTVKAGGSAVSVSGVLVSDRAVMLTLASDIRAGQTVTISYAAPSADDDSAAIQDNNGRGRGALTLATGGVLTPTLEAGLRYDSGDAETGAGLEMGAGLAYASGRLNVQVNARGLLAHEDTDCEEWGMSVSVGFRPREDGGGPALNVGSAGGPRRAACSRCGPGPMPRGLVRGGAAEMAQRLNIEVGYGLHGRNGRGLWVPFIAAESDQSGNQALRLGVKLTAGPNVDAGLEIGRRGNTDPAAGQRPESAMQLRWALRWCATRRRRGR